MIKNYISKWRMVFGAFALLGLMASCDDTNDWDVDQSYNRSFRPTSLASTGVTANTADLTWGAIPGTEKYLLELSMDSMEFKNIVGSYETTEAGYSLVDLEGSTGYSVRIKAQPVLAGKAESEYAAIYFKTKSEQIMTAVSDADKTATTVILRWTPGKRVSTLFIKDSQGVVVKEVSLDDTHIANGFITVEGLTPQTSYLAEIFNGENRRGFVGFTTFPEVPAAEHIVYWNAGDVVTQAFFDGLAQYSNVTIALPAGSYFGSSEAMIIPSGLSLHFFGLPGVAKAVLSQNVFTLGATHSFIRFTNLDITGVGYDQSGTANGITYNYLINQTPATNVGSIEFENCSLHDFGNCPVRVQGTDAKYIGQLLFNSCIAYNFKDTYYFINNNAATSVIDNIVMTNSTFYNVSRFILHSASNNSKVAISDCTFDKMLAAGRYFIDFNKSGPTSELSITNCIFGSTMDATAKGIRATKTASVLNSYAATDWVLGGNAIPGLTTYSKTSADLFVNPTQGDLTIKDDTFEGRNSSGDPRWRIE